MSQLKSMRWTTRGRKIFKRGFAAAQEGLFSISPSGFVGDPLALGPVNTLARLQQTASRGHRCSHHVMQAADATAATGFWAVCRISGASAMQVRSEGSRKSACWEALDAVLRSCYRSWGVCAVFGSNGQSSTWWWINFTSHAAEGLASSYGTRCQFLTFSTCCRS